MYLLKCALLIRHVSLVERANLCLFSRPLHSIICTDNSCSPVGASGHALGMIGLLSELEAFHFHL